MKARIGGRDVSWREAGSGRTVLFLHGFPFNGSLWDAQLAALPEGWRGVAPDLRGFGASEGSADPQYTMDMFADDAAALLTHVGARRAVICGLSMGGYIALAMHRRHPSVFGGLVLADTRATADTEEARKNRVQLAKRVLVEGNGVVVDSMLPRLFAPATLQKRPQLVEQVRAMMATTSPDTMSRAMLGMAARPSSEDGLRDIAVPTLVLVGAEDAITDRGEAQLMARAIRGSRFEAFQDAGHLSNLEATDAFNQALQRFLTNF